MRTDAIVGGLFCWILALGLSACGAQKTEEPEAPKAAADEPADDKSAEAADEGDDKEEEAPAEAKEEELPERTPERFITEPGTFFAFNFKESDVGTKKIEECEKKSKGDPEKRSKCVTKAQKEFEADGMRFIKDDDGTWWWITMGKRGGRAVILHRIEFEVGGQTKDSITLKLKGKDRGSKPMSVPPELKIQVPNDYEILIDDQKRGKMVYKARVETEARGDAEEKK